MSEWQPIEAAPKDGTPLRFLTVGGEEYDGTWGPYWCGSDCPCDVAGEGIEPLTCVPECWCAYRDGQTVGEEVTPTHWMLHPPPPASHIQE